MSTSRYEAAKAMWRKDAEVLASVSEQVSEELYEALYGLIEACKGKVAVMGMGTSGIAARKAAHMLRVADFPAFYLSPGDCAHGGIGALSRDDIVIMLSRGGTTIELVELLPSIKRKGVKLITVTANNTSPLAQAADLTITLDVPESDHKGVTANSSILAVIALFDAVADELTNRAGYDDEVLYYNHIHGNVGDVLKDRLKI